MLYSWLTHLFNHVGWEHTRCKGSPKYVREFLSGKELGHATIKTPTSVLEKYITVLL